MYIMHINLALFRSFPTVKDAQQPRAHHPSWQQGRGLGHQAQGYPLRRLLPALGSESTLAAAMASKRVSARNKGPAIEGRWSVEEPDSAGQAERDRYFQEKMADERTSTVNAAAGLVLGDTNANAPTLSDTELIDKFLANPKSRGAARGVMAELKRIDPSGLRQTSVALEERCAALGWRLEHMGVTIGTVIHGPDLREAQSDEAIGAMHALMLERKVIFFRNQDIDYAQHRDFGKRFGSLEVFPFASPPAGEFPEILPITSGPGVPTGAASWHSDVTWRKSPSLGSILYCEQAPPLGGETGFADTYCTLQGLPLATREALRGMTCIHDFDNFRYTQQKAGVSPETIEELRKSYPVAVRAENALPFFGCHFVLDLTPRIFTKTGSGQRQGKLGGKRRFVQDHPMVRTHPDTGGEMLCEFHFVLSHLTHAALAPLEVEPRGLVLARLNRLVMCVGLAVHEQMSTLGLASGWRAWSRRSQTSC